MSTPRDDGESDVRGLASAPEPGLVRDVLAFVVRTKKWWLLPLLVAFVLFSALTLLGGTGLAPFIYPLF